MPDIGDFIRRSRRSAKIAIATAGTPGDFRRSRRSAYKIARCVAGFGKGNKKYDPHLMLVDRRVIPGVCLRYSLFKVIVEAEVPPSIKIDLFEGSIGKNGEGDF